MDLSAITSDDIPHVVRGHNAAGNGDPFNSEEHPCWKAAYLLHPRNARKGRPELVIDNTNTTETH